jgi:phosphohistidine phosphatase
MRTILLSLLLSISAQGLAQSKTIYLARHAKSSHKDTTLIDFDRPLAKRGFNDASTVGLRLGNMDITLDYVLASPSMRTMQTLKLITPKLRFLASKAVQDSSLYRCSPSTMTHRLSEVDDKHNSIMIFGHNPAITRCANYLQVDTLFGNVPTTGVVAIEFDITNWSDIINKKGKLKFFEYPKKPQN